MTEPVDMPRWLKVHEAARIYVLEVGVSEEVLRGVVPKEPGIMWLSDQWVAVHERAAELVVDRDEFEAVLRQIRARRSAPAPVWPHSESAEGMWIGLHEAFATYVQRLGLPKGLHRELISGLECRPGLMWLSDHAILLYERPTGLGFDRDEFEAIMLKIKPVGGHGALRRGAPFEKHTSSE
jgi:hypothetical protein